MENKTFDIIFISVLLTGSILFAYLNDFHLVVLWFALFIIKLVWLAVDVMKDHIDKTFKSE